MAQFGHVRRSEPTQCFQQSGFVAILSDFSDLLGELLKKNMSGLFVVLLEISGDSQPRTLTFAPRFVQIAEERCLREATA